MKPWAQFQALPYLLRLRQVRALGLARHDVRGMVLEGRLRVVLVPGAKQWFYRKCDLAPVLGVTMDWSEWDDPRQFPLLLGSKHLLRVGLGHESIEQAVRNGLLGQARDGQRRKFYKWEVGQLIGRNDDRQ